MRRAMKRFFAKLERRNVHEVRPPADKRRARLRIGIWHPPVKTSYEFQSKSGKQSFALSTPPHFANNGAPY
jgi:hypothetical protein